MYVLKLENVVLVKFARCRHIHGMEKNKALPAASNLDTVETVVSCIEVKT